MHKRFFEILTHMLVKNSAKHDAARKTEAEFKRSASNGQIVESYHNKIQFIEQWNYFDLYQKRWCWICWTALIPVFKKHFNNHIINIQFGVQNEQTVKNEISHLYF